jgi:hypothetical protein
MKTCYECANEMIIDDTGVSYHVTPEGAIDHDADADHVAIDEDQVTAL